MLSWLSHQAGRFVGEQGPEFSSRGSDQTAVNKSRHNIRNINWKPCAGTERRYKWLLSCYEWRLKSPTQSQQMNIPLIALPSLTKSTRARLALTAGALAGKLK